MHRLVSQMSRWIVMTTLLGPTVPRAEAAMAAIETVTAVEDEPEGADVSAGSTL
jgi:hypothetical protein